MVRLVADVGGTNARLAIASEGVIIEQSIRRFRGDDYADFDVVVREYLGRMGSPQVTAACVAVAGPVRFGRARLTNRDWHFDEAQLTELMGADKVVLINDLTALGYAIPALRDDGTDVLRPCDPLRQGNGQALVVGFGTGYNVCATKMMRDGNVCALECEEGHTRLPDIIHQRLEAEIGQAVGEFFSAEETFAGRGLARLHLALHGGNPVRGEDIAAAAASGSPDASRTYDLFAEMAGMLCRELALRFMPLDGIYMAGSVGRSLSMRPSVFEQGFLAEPLMRQIPEGMPVSVIKDDMAPLQGCLSALNWS